MRYVPPAALLISSIALALALGSGPLPAQGAVDVGDVELHYERSGTGPPLVLLHGWTHDLRVWQLQVPALEREYSVIRYDRRGWGRSGGSTDWARDADDLNALLDRLELPSAYVLGHSQGAQSALHFALEYPDRVDALILVGPPPPAGFGVPWTGPDALSGEIFRIAEAHGVDSVWTLLLSHPISEGFEPGQPGAGIAAAVWETNAERALADPRSLTGSGPPPDVARLPDLDVPTLVLTGEWEMPYFQIVADAVAYAADAERRTIAGGGHAIQLQEPERFNAAVLRFLRHADGRQ